ncbi:glutamate-tRNA ligase [Rickenella mellea]|uniref:glutamate--tRNA ligase n=1 Tax=Rickenella mellea TaxID=50990 RepID=A0A4Y7PRD4_9AGAM|nr:glutamate-tRNA ligase [Rickenella mellea]
MSDADRGSEKQGQTYSLTIPLWSTPFPLAVISLACFVRLGGVVKLATIELQDIPGNEPVIHSLDGLVASGKLECLVYLASVSHLDTEDRFTTQIHNISVLKDFKALSVTLEALDYHLALRTVFSGKCLSADDFAVWGAIRGNLAALGILKQGQLAHLRRFYSYMESLPAVNIALNIIAEAKSKNAKLTTTAASFSVGLDDAVHGEVVTRFPPEPSGYLHIGHVKAAFLNQYFARMYDGKLVVRMDDTNPKKESAAFEKAILEDLETLGITPDCVTYTSDYFEHIYKQALGLIRLGCAYTDDTDATLIKEQRRKGVASARRDAGIEDTLLRFQGMVDGSEEGQHWCLRARISADDPNKAMRDPVIYRVVMQNHHRTGSQWKVYPTYDFACPVVDSLEGITHALRTKEYRDRNAQYHWMQNVLGIRKVHIRDFSRLNFQYTLLSKRELLKLVDAGTVDGWDDPRLPTLRGLVRRGMTVEAILQFMRSQGPSQADIHLEWDGLWAMNKKLVDQKAPRFCAIIHENIVSVAVVGARERQSKDVPLHKKQPELGMKTLTYSSNILIEQVDAISLAVDEEVTLMDWGNAIVRSREVDASTGIVTSVGMDLHLDGDVKKTQKKLTWLTNDIPGLGRAILVDFDYLFTKKKFLKNKDVPANFYNPVTEFQTEAVCDANVCGLQVGVIVQFERKGYYRLDFISQEPRQLKFIRVPDGSAETVSLKAAGERHAAAL